MFEIFYGIQGCFNGKDTIVKIYSACFLFDDIPQLPFTSHLPHPPPQQKPLKTPCKNQKSRTPWARPTPASTPALSLGIRCGTDSYRGFGDPFIAFLSVELFHCAPCTLEREWISLAGFVFAGAVPCAVECVQENFLRTAG